ncbi:MAG: NAD(P)H-dependent oxidoreductase [Nostocales cyanobacterium 94392]|nr:NAD(P)H-dependent oxidoreductase [Nostocales cyanobacterium 94392]
MTNQAKILAFAGSVREASFNKRLVQIAATGAKLAGAEVTYIDLKNYPMPLFNEDLEAKEGLPQAVLEFKRLMKAHQGFLIACPEYNSSITPLLKNTIDWVSRPEPGEAPMALSCFRGKVAAIMATSPGGLGGLRGLVHLRSILESIGVLVIPEQKAISNAYQAFDDTGNLIDVKEKEAIAIIGARLTEVTAKLKV